MFSYILATVVVIVDSATNSSSSSSSSSSSNRNSTGVPMVLVNESNSISSQPVAVIIRNHMNSDKY